MDMTDIARNTSRGFPVPHAFEELFGDRYIPQEKYFYVILCKLSYTYADSDGWFLGADAGQKGHGILHGFDKYGITQGICKSARKKLIADGLLECRYIHGPKGYRIGIAYRLLDDRLHNHTRMVYDAILNRQWREEKRSISKVSFEWASVHN